MSSGYMRANLSFITGKQRERNRLRQTLLKSYRADTHSHHTRERIRVHIHPSAEYEMLNALLRWIHA